MEKGCPFLYACCSCQRYLHPVQRSSPRLQPLVQVAFASCLQLLLEFRTPPALPPQWLQYQASSARSLPPRGPFSILQVLKSLINSPWESKILQSPLFQKKTGENTSKQSIHNKFPHIIFFKYLFASERNPRIILCFPWVRHVVFCTSLLSSWTFSLPTYVLNVVLK